MFRDVCPAADRRGPRSARRWRRAPGTPAEGDRWKPPAFHDDPGEGSDGRGPAVPPRPGADARRARVRRRSARRRSHRPHAGPVRRAHVRVIDEGIAYAGEIGFDDIRERGVRTADDLPAELVYAGFSFGVLPAQKLAQTRPGARGALLFYSCIPISGEWAFGPWPDGVPVQIHGMDNDPIFVGEGDIDAAREIVATVDRRGALPLPRRPALLRRQLAAVLRRGGDRAPHPTRAGVPGSRLTIRSTQATDLDAAAVG